MRGAIVKVITAGLVACLAFALFSTIWFGVAGEGFWRPLNLIAHTLWRQAPTDGGFHASSVLLGLLALAVVGVLVMVPFAALGLGAGLGPVALIGGAAIYANVVWVFGHYIVWEPWDPLAAHEFSPGVAWVAHMVAGLAGGATLALMKPLGGRATVGNPQAGRAHA